MTEPAGFSHMTFDGQGLIDLLGPFCWRPEGEGFVYGFQSDKRHGNPNGVIHGGALSAFADTLTGHFIEHACGRKCATIALDARFIAAGRIGAWVWGRARMRKLTRTLAFLDVDIEAEDALIATVSCVYRVFAHDAADGRS
ncbi:MAG: PaaI family thioesterase [Rhodoblastus sp.]